MATSLPAIALTQGDPAGVGPEILINLLAEGGYRGQWRPLLVAERAAIEALPASASSALRERFVPLSATASRAEFDRLAEGQIALVDPVAQRRRVRPGRSGPADAAGAVAAIDAAAELAQAGVVDAMVTAPVSKESIARHHLAEFRGHTEYLAEKAGLEHYGRQYLMTFLAPDLQVALLSTHLPLREAIDRVRRRKIVEALELLSSRAPGRIAVPGLNPHAGEGGLMGDDESRIIRPAVEEARQKGVDVHGPESPDSLFARARNGEFDWVLALYHDQGLIAVKTASFGLATNWTLGLPYLRTSVDHGTAFGIAGRGIVDARPMAGVIETTLGLISGQLPRERSPGP